MLSLCSLWPSLSHPHRLRFEMAVNPQRPAKSELEHCSKIEIAQQLELEILKLLPPPGLLDATSPFPELSIKTLATRSSWVRVREAVPIRWRSVFFLNSYSDPFALRFRLPESLTAVVGKRRFVLSVSVIDKQYKFVYTLPGGIGLLTSVSPSRILNKFCKEHYPQEDPTGKGWDAIYYSGMSLLSWRRYQFVKLITRRITSLSTGIYSVVRNTSPLAEEANLPAHRCSLNSFWITFAAVVEANDIKARLSLVLPCLKVIVRPR